MVPWLREVVGDTPAYVFNNQRWVEIPEGFVPGTLLQPVRNLPNAPVSALNESSLGPGMWVEVTVPYVDVVMENTPSSDSWVEARVEDGLPVRFYYGQVFWIDRIKTGEQGQVLYRVNPNYYGGVDMLWASAEAFRPILAEELTPINPDVENKRVVVNVTDQSMSCLENEREIYFCRVSTGAKFDMYGNVVDRWSTPVGSHWITRKYYSLQMSGGTTGAGLRPARHRLVDDLCHRRGGGAFDLLAQQLRRCHVARLCERDAGGCQVAVPLDAAERAL